MDLLPFPVSARRLVAFGLLVVVVVAVAVRHFSTHAAPVSLRVAPLAGDSGASAAPRARAASAVVVDVEGAVRRPGLVHLPSGSRVADAVLRAGGATRRADRTGVNLAAPVSDGQQVLVPVRAGGAATAAPRLGGAPSAGPVSLSTATAEQLDALPGVGPVTAQKIVDYRAEHGSFHSVDELDAIPGIGPARLADLRDLVVP